MIGGLSLSYDAHGKLATWRNQRANHYEYVHTTNEYLVTLSIDTKAKALTLLCWAPKGWGLRPQAKRYLVIKPSTPSST